MKKLYSLLIPFLTCGICEAQNLVPNGDFEQFSSCPTGYSQLYNALFWINPSSNATPDYFNQCNPSLVGVPANSWGYQTAHSGVAYGGGILYYANFTAREYVEVPLISSLITNNCYHFEMYINVAGKCKYSTDAIGIYFSDPIVTGIPNSLPLPFTPQINNGFGNIPDTLNWTLISGNYIAQGGEEYLIIGNFKDDINTNAILINNSGTLNMAYIYIDDVSLSPCTGTSEENQDSEINICPNPFSDKLNITSKGNEPVEISLYDVTSRKIYNQSFTNSTTINTAHLSKGIYIYELRNNSEGSGGVVKKGKLVKD